MCALRSPFCQSFMAVFKVKWFLSIGIFLLGCSLNVNANHIGGAEVTYKCTSTPGVFEITLILYRNCDGGSTLCAGSCGAPCSQTMNVYGVDSGYSTQNMGSFTLSLVNVKDVNINSACPGTKNTCTNMGCVAPGTYNPSVERYEFKGFVNIGPTSTIPSACCNVRFVWETCCRDSSIYTLVSPATTNFYTDAIVNRCLAVSPCNSSPQFLNEPLIAICGGENYIFNNAAVDPDADSLSFSFAPALYGFNNAAAYTVPFTYNTPMPWSGAENSEFPGGIRCNAFNGDISFTPGTAGGQDFTGVVVVEAKQWKYVNGIPKVIGITRRDIQMVVLGNCAPNNPPRLIINPPNLPNTNSTETAWDVCAGEQVCFNIIAKDTDFIPPLVSDTTSLTWDSSLVRAGATFTLISAATAREKVYQFCWTPHDSFVRKNPYYFTVSAKDNRCPNPGRISRSFSVSVKGKVSLSIHKQYVKCGSFQVGYTNNKPSVLPGLVQWQISRFPGDFGMTNNPSVFTNVVTCPILQFREKGKYLVILMAKNVASFIPSCAQFFYDTIEVHDSMLFANRVDFTINNDTQCLKGNSFVFTDTSSVKLISRKWDFGDGSLDTGRSVTKTYSAGQKFDVKYTVKDTNNCVALLSRPVTLVGNKLVQPVCLVTVDSLIHKNIILWKAVNLGVTTNFRIYKEQPNGIDLFLGNSPVKLYNIFIDTTSTPDVKAERYLVSTIDTCGNESAKTGDVQSIFLSVYHEFSNTWSLSWTSILEGVDIFRGNSPGNLKLVTSVQAGVSAYKDIEAPEGLTYYMVSTKPGNSCDSAGRYLSSQSNIVFAKRTGLSELKLSQLLDVSPNPVTDVLTIQSRSGQSVSMKLYDAMGRLVFTNELHKTLSQINMGQLSDGFYTLEFKSGNEVYYQKLIKR